MRDFLFNVYKLVATNASIHWIGMPDVPPILSHGKLFLQLFLLFIYLIWYCLMISLFSNSSIINFNFGLFIHVRIIFWDWHSFLGVSRLMKGWFDYFYGFTGRFLGFKPRENGFDKIMRRVPTNRCLFLVIVECFTWITMIFIVIEDQRGCSCGYLSRLWYVPNSSFLSGFSNILVIVAVDDFLLIYSFQIVFQMVVLYFDILVTARTLA